MCALSHLDGTSAHRLHLLSNSDSNSALLIHDRGTAGSPEISGWVRYFLSMRDYLSLPWDSRGKKSSISCVNRPQKQAGDQVFPCSRGLVITVKRISKFPSLHSVKLPLKSIGWEKTTRYNILSLSITDFIWLWNASVCVVEVAILAPLFTAWIKMRMESTVEVWEEFSVQFS